VLESFNYIFAWLSERVVSIHNFDLYHPLQITMHMWNLMIVNLWYVTPVNQMCSSLEEKDSFRSSKIPRVLGMSNITLWWSLSTKQPSMNQDHYCIHATARAKRNYLEPNTWWRNVTSAIHHIEHNSSCYVHMIKCNSKNWEAWVPRRCKTVNSM
jgi:hypothetical protein